MLSCSGVILAGGASRRMGRDKAWIEFEGRALIERVIERLHPVCQEIILVASDQEPYQKLGPSVVGDTFPGKGSLGGIYSGLSSARFERAIVVACDMPFLNPELLHYMLMVSVDFDLVIPSATGFQNPRGSVKEKPKLSGAARPTAKDSDLHPLHAIYSKRCLEPIESRIREDDLRMISFHPDVRVRILSNGELERFDPDHLSLFNVNTPDDLILAEGLAGQERLVRYD